MSLVKELRDAANHALKQSSSNKPTELKQIIQTLANFYLANLSIIERKLLENEELSSIQTELRLRDASIQHLNSEIGHMKVEMQVKDELNQTKDRLLAAQATSLTSQPSFARAASQPPSTPPPTPINIHQVILKPKQIPGEPPIVPKDVRALFKAIYSVGELRKKNITVVDIRTGPKAVSVLVETQDQVARLITDINANSEINLMVSASELYKRNPTIQLDNIDPDIKPENLVTQLIADNQDKFRLEPSEIYLLATKRPPPRQGSTEARSYTAFFAVSPALYNSLANQRLILSHSATTAIETFHVNHCSHCLEYSHSTTKCPRNKRGNTQSYLKRCFKCSTAFTSNDDFKTHRSTCNTNSCFHCTNAPNRATNRTDTNHRPLSSQCPIYRDKLNFLKRTTNYDPSCSSLVTHTSSSQQVNRSQPQTLTSTQPNLITPTSNSSLSPTSSQMTTSSNDNTCNNSPKTQTYFQKAILNALSV